MHPVNERQLAQRIVCRARPSQGRHRYFACHLPRLPEGDILRKTESTMIPNRWAFLLNHSRWEHEIHIFHLETYMNVILQVPLLALWGLWTKKGCGRYKGKNNLKMRKEGRSLWAWDRGLGLREKSLVGIPGLSYLFAKEYTYSPLNITSAAFPRPD